MDTQLDAEFKAKILVEALPFIQKYYGQTVVVKYGGNAMINEELKDAVIHDLVLLNLVGVKDVYKRQGSERIYGLNLKHKHLPEMECVCGLMQPPVFVPIVGDFYKGMATTVMLPGVDAHRVHEALMKHYEGQKLVSVAPFGGEEPVIYANTLAGHDGLKLIVCGHEEQAIVTALFDNLGKGASGAAVQNMNIMLGLDEATGLTV